MIVLKLLFEHSAMTTSMYEQVSHTSEQDESKRA
jgi:hypothetical protein